MSEDNVEKRLASAEALVRLDGWNNIITGLGDPRYDKRLATVPQRQHMSQPELAELYRADPTAARIVDLLPDEMTREWCDVRLGGDKDLEEAVGDALEDMDVRGIFNQAEKFARNYGGALVLLGADDGQTDLTQPLDESNIRSFEWLNVFDKQEAWPVKWYENAIGKKYGQIELYQLQPHSVTYTNLVGPDGKPFRSGMPVIHESRFLRFDGVKLPRWQMLQNHGWGDSVLERTYETVRDYAGAWGNVSALLHDFSLAVYKIEGLADLVASNQDEVVKKRIELIELMKSNLRAVLIDNNEDFERKPTPFAQLPELLDKFAQRLAHVTGIPVTLLMGQSPAGLNATGEQDGEWWNNVVRSKQVTNFGPKLNRVLRLLLRSQSGPAEGMEPESWSHEWRPLRQLTEQETVEMRNKQAQTDQVYVSMGALDPDEVGKSRFGPNGYSIETTVDWDAREAAALSPADEALGMQEGLPGAEQDPDGGGGLTAAETTEEAAPEMPDGGGDVGLEATSEAPEEPSEAPEDPTDAQPEATEDPETPPGGRSGGALGLEDQDLEKDPDQPDEPQSGPAAEPEDPEEDPEAEDQPPEDDEAAPEEDIDAEEAAPEAPEEESGDIDAELEDRDEPVTEFTTPSEEPEDDEEPDETGGFEEPDNAEPEPDDEDIDPATAAALIKVLQRIAARGR